MPTIVKFSDGSQGTLEPNNSYSAGDRGLTLVRMENGREVLVPQDALVAQNDGSYLLPLRLDELDQPLAGAGIEDTLVLPASMAAEADTVIPIIAETLSVSRQAVETGRIRITKTVTEREEQVDEPLLRQEVVVERVARNEVVQDAPGNRWEGDTLIVPLLEEVLVVEKRLMLKEEIRITRIQTETHQPQQVLLRTEEAVVERVAPPDAPLASQSTLD